MREGTAVGALGLRDLVLVVRENQVKAAGVNVDRRAEVLVDHCRALDMPARTALAAPRRIPRGFARLCRLPDREIHRVLFLLAYADARTRLQLLHRLMAELTVVRIGLGAEIHIAVRRKVGVTVVEQLLHNVDNRVHCLGGARMHSRLADTQPLGIRVILLDITVSDDVEVHALFVGLVNHLVVNVGEVLDKLHLVAAVLKVATQQVEHDERARVADMEIVIHGRAAGIHFDLARRDRDELLLLAGQGVVQFHMTLSFIEIILQKYSRLFLSKRRRYVAVPLLFVTRVQDNGCVPRGV